MCLIPVNSWFGDFHAGFCFFPFSFTPSRFSLFISAWLNFTSVPSPMVRERSRSRDDDPRHMWGNPNPNLPHDPSRHGRWTYTPALRRTHRVLILVDLIATKQWMDEQMSDVMSVTSCGQLPDLRTPEEMALFTYAAYACLLTPSQIQIASFTTPGESTSTMPWISNGDLRSSFSPNHHSPTTRT